MTRNEMLMQIMQLDFYLIDLGLYLNTHPDDKDAVRMFNDYQKEVNALKERYKREVGPLTLGTSSENRWNWTLNPWPWENMFD